MTGPAPHADSRPVGHQLDAAILDSGDVFWQSWIAGRDWAPHDAHLPWVPWSQVGSIGNGLVSGHG